MVSAEGALGSSGWSRQRRERRGAALGLGLFSPTGCGCNSRSVLLLGLCLLGTVHAAPDASLSLPGATCGCCCYLLQGQINNPLAAYQPSLPPQADPPADAAGAVAPDVAAGSLQSQEQQGAAAAAAGSGRPPPAPSRTGPVVGAAAGWFKPLQIHPLERAALPEFFNGTHTEGGKVGATWSGCGWCLHLGGWGQGLGASRSQGTVCLGETCCMQRVS